MKNVRLFLLSFVFAATALLANAQAKTEVIPVSGNCGMCKANIEKAAKTAGVSVADWNKDSKMLTVKYDEKKTSTEKIQKAIANVGYDTRDVKGVDEAYEKLHKCCKYERTMKYEGNALKNKGGDIKMDCCKEMKDCKAHNNAKAGKDGRKDCCAKK